MRLRARATAIAALCLVPAASGRAKPPCPPVQLIYDRNDVIAEARRDTNADCRHDTIVYYSGGSAERVELDTDHDGQADLWVHLESDGRTIARQEWDTTGDGRPDEPFESSARVIDDIVPPPRGRATGEAMRAAAGCYERSEVQRYLASVEKRTLNRWNLPSGVDANQEVTLRFNLDTEGAVSRVSLVRASDEALGTSAVAALEDSAPFGALPEDAGCLALLPITATFRNPAAVGAGGGCGLGIELALLLPLFARLRSRRPMSPAERSKDTRRLAHSDERPRKQGDPKNPDHGQGDRSVRLVRASNLMSGNQEAKRKGQSNRCEPGRRGIVGTAGAQQDLNY